MELQGMKREGICADPQVPFLHEFDHPNLRVAGADIEFQFSVDKNGCRG